jgi:hypothetical protein
LPPVEQDSYNRIVESVRDSVGGRSFDAAWEDGRTMTLEEVVAFALKDDRP